MEDLLAQARTERWQLSDDLERPDGVLARVSWGNERGGHGEFIDELGRHSGAPYMTSALWGKWGDSGCGHAICAQGGAGADGWIQGISEREGDVSAVRSTMDD